MNGHDDMIDFADDEPTAALVEAYLDGELMPGEAIVFERRLAEEPELAEALEQARAGRVLRMCAFESCEPDAAAQARLMARVRQETLRQRVSPAAVSANRWAWTKLAGGVAAVLLVGFGIGVVGNYDLGEPTANDRLPTDTADQYISEIRPQRPGGFTIISNNPDGTLRVEQYDGRSSFERQIDPTGQGPRHVSSGR